MQDWDLYSELFFNILNTLEVNNSERPAVPVGEPLQQQPERVPPSPPTEGASGVEVALQAKSVREVFG
jgi:hypothetical protein